MFSSGKFWNFFVFRYPERYEMESEIYLMSFRNDVSPQMLYLLSFDDFNFKLLKLETYMNNINI